MEVMVLTQNEGREAVELCGALNVKVTYWNFVPTLGTQAVLWIVSWSFLCCLLPLAVTQGGRDCRKASLKVLWKVRLTSQKLAA